MSDASERRGRGARLGATADAAAAARITALENLVAQYRVLLETSAAITASTDLQETLQLITRLVTERLGAAWCDLYDYEQARDEFVVVAYYQLPGLGIDSSGWVGTHYDSDNWTDLAACVAERRPCVWYRDDEALTARELEEMDAWSELSNMSVPLVYRGDVIGLIDVGECRTLRRWSEDDRYVLQAIADQAAIAIVNARAYARLAEQATTDGLTGLFNHRHFLDHLKHEVVTARRYGQHLSMAIVDLDDFKGYNDRFGHLRGDRALIETADILRAVTRADVDIVARYGGDEFVVILPQARAEGPEPTAARNVAERIRAAVAAHRFSEDDTVPGASAGEADAAVEPDDASGGGARAHGSDTAKAAGAGGVAMTVSIGVAGIGLGGYGPQELLDSADKALYLAKRQGKDRVVVFGT